MSLEGASKGSEEAVSRALVLPSDIALHFTMGLFANRDATIH